MMSTLVIAACAGAVLGFVLGLAFARRQLHAYEARFAQALEDARTDPLTGLWNRKAFDENLELHAAVARRYAVPLTLLLLDVDHFKKLNDTQGHAAGDRLLRELANVIRAAVREADFVARLGGDELAILLPQTDAAGASVLASRLREKFRKEHERPETPQLAGGTTFSIGIAGLAPNEPAASLVERADRALYHAKESGRDRVHWHEGTNVRPVVSEPGAKRAVI
jgi:diguanylate cyclase